MFNLSRRTVRVILVLVASFCALLLLLFGVTPIHFHKTQSHEIHVEVAHSTCEGTLYPHLCVSTIASFPHLASKSFPQVISSLLNHTMYEVVSSSSNCSGLRHNLRNLDQREQGALDDCLYLLDDTLDDIRSSIERLSGSHIPTKSYYNLQSLLSGASTNMHTCLEGFDNSKGKVKPIIKDRLIQISHHMSNSLTLLNKAHPHKSPYTHQFPHHDSIKHGFPSWLTSQDQNLLTTSDNETKFDLVVAKDGTGNFTTIGEAVAAAPDFSNTRFVIYIKAGAYFENVLVIKKKTNLTFIGDGIGLTIVKASRNYVDGWSTYLSATVGVDGYGFMAKGITFENFAGPDKHQAVAFRSSSDTSAFYRCSFIGFQDTLYVHRYRQFYRECDIYGTVDFIFGDAAVVIQNCNLYARKPNNDQKNTFTAQGREDPAHPSGISVINSKVAASSDLIPVKSSIKSYLGRPWKMYSRTVFIHCDIEDLIDPTGWLEWNETFALDTLYYGEYENRGPGSNTNARVTWKGYRVINSSAEASLFTVANFIQGDQWLNSTDIPFFPNLNP